MSPVCKVHPLWSKLTVCEWECEWANLFVTDKPDSFTAADTSV